MRLARRMELQHSWIKSMVAVARFLLIFPLQDETNLTRFMRMFIEAKAAWHERFGDTDPVELAPAKLVSEAMHSFCRAH
jgi:hypothetical protein